MIWYNKSISLEGLNLMSKNTLGEHLNIEFVAIGDDYLKATMPVNATTHQPFGLLHGGASAALAETVGSVAAWLCINPEKQNCVGLEINCNHVRGKRDGIVTATARPLHIGGSTHVWEIRIEDESQNLICISRLTMAVIKKL
ncbi:MAG TPA: hotdog fold thioesterase [Edaphocola sp.]|nr:hotdog fold thioesterase [Edaphocola sp.]